MDESSGLKNCMRDSAEVLFFRVEVSEDDACGDAVSVWEAGFDYREGRFMIQPPDQLFPASKESLVSLLELAEELECEAAWVVLDRKHVNFKEQLRAFGYLGFAMAPAVQAPAGRLFMRYDLN